MTLDRFHPAVASWFAANLGTPTACQEQAWEALAAGRHTLIAADPLNLTGIVCLGERVPATTSTRIAFRDGVPVATLSGTRKIEFFETQPPEQEWAARNALLRRRIPRLPPRHGLPA